MENLQTLLSKSIEAQKPIVLATVVRDSGGSPARAGAKILVHPDGSIDGTVGGGILEETIIKDSLAALGEGKPRLVHYSLKMQGEDAIGSVCGGDVEVFIEPYSPTPHLIIVGGGHIGQPLRAIGEIVGYKVSVIDVLSGRATVPGLETVTLDENAYVVIITADHVSDEAALRIALNAHTRYIGMIGSKSKLGVILDHLRADGYAQESLDRIHSPIGLDLGGPEPAEIALAIMAEIVATRRGGSGEKLSVSRKNA